MIGHSPLNAKGLRQRGTLLNFGQTKGQIMTPQKITDEFTVAPQIALEDVAEIVRSGFKSVICNRPDGESAEQTPFALIESEVRKAGLEFRHIPVVSGAMTQEDIYAMAAALREMPAPVFAYCRSGTRCGVLFRAVQAQAQKNA
jgi:uncharacterized protein (TIGR01244 family)